MGSQLGHGSQVPPAELVHGVTAFGQGATVGCELRLKDRFVGRVILRERGSHGQGLSHAERNGVVLSWREPVVATVLRVGLIRGLRQRKGSLQGGRSQRLRMGYRQTGPHPRRLGMTLLAATPC